MDETVKWHFVLLSLIYLVVSSPAIPQTGTPTAPPVRPSAAPAGTQPSRSANLDLARTYQRLKKWQEAEKYFQEAAKEDNPTVWSEALTGIEKVRAGADSDLQELAGGQYYRRVDVPDKAEEQYVAALKSNSAAVRKTAQDALRELQGALWLQRKFELWLQYVKYAAAVAGAISVWLLVAGSLRIRHSIEMGGFAEVGEKAQGKLPFWLSYVRARIRSLTTVPTAQISPLITSPPMLYLALPSFRDELPEPEKDLDVGGTKLPLASIVGLYVRPKVKIVGGWTVPLETNDGTAFAAFFQRPVFSADRLSNYVSRPIRAAKVDEDLEAFAYDVYVKAMESYAL